MLLRILLFISVPAILAYKLENGKQYHSDHFNQQGEKGQSGYVGHHQTEQGQKGHHDKENYRKEYAEKGGNSQGHHHKDGYYGNHHQGHKGSNGYHFAEQGSYAKGHSTKGHHNIHKLDEFKKNTDFFDEDNDEAFEEKHGGFEAQKAFKKGGHHKGGHINKGYNEGKYGQSGFSEKGAKFFKDQGYDIEGGHKDYYGNEEKFGKQQGNEGFKKFGFENVHKLK